MHQDDTNRVCQTCGNTFRIFPSEVATQPGKYCSSACYHAARPSRVECTCRTCATVFMLKPSDVRKGGGKFCSRRCQIAFSATPEAVLARFWTKVAKGDGEDACWLWTGACFRIEKGRGGYGKFSLDGHVIAASRASWILHRGAIPEEVFVCHNCPNGDNPRCVRPSHLFLGTAKQNSEDMVRKGRSAVGDRNGSRTHPERYPYFKAS